MLGNVVVETTSSTTHAVKALTGELQTLKYSKTYRHGGIIHSPETKVNR